MDVAYTFDNDSYYNLLEKLYLYIEKSRVLC